MIRPDFQGTRAVVTGIGIINPCGIGKESFWSNITSGKTGIKYISRFDTNSSPVKVAGEIQDFEPEKYIPQRLIFKTDRFTHYALAAADLALRDSNIELENIDPYRVGVSFGNNAGGWDIAERGFYEFYRDGPSMVNPWQATAWFPAAPQGYITIRYGIKGYSKSFVCDRASGASAFYFGIKSILDGKNDVVLIGGAEAPITPFGINCYYETGDLSNANSPIDAYKAFDKGSTGIILGEGSTVIIVESLQHALSRDAKIYGEVLSGKMTTDNSPRSGKSLESAMEDSLIGAMIKPCEVDLLLAEGCGNQLDDNTEINAISKVFSSSLDSMLVSIPKTLSGHLYGASGVTEIACGLLSIETEKIPLMQKPYEIDRQNRLSLVTSSTNKSVLNVMINSRAREGVNVCSIVGKLFI
jgi:3-oxoacyl-[acyl-carrier-protein] synthase II